MFTRSGLLLCCILLAACDEKLQIWLKRASDRQEQLQQQKAKRDLKNSLPITSVEIDRLLGEVAQSDAEFLIGKTDDSVRILNGRDFAKFLQRKSRWLGGGIQDVPTWLDEIGSDEFFSRRPYRVRLRDGQEIPFRQWVLVKQ